DRSPGRGAFRRFVSGPDLAVEGARHAERPGAGDRPQGRTARQRRPGPGARAAGRVVGGDDEPGATDQYAPAFADAADAEERLRFRNLGRRPGGRPYTRIGGRPDATAEIDRDAEGGARTGDPAQVGGQTFGRGEMTDGPGG